MKYLIALAAAAMLAGCASPEPWWMHTKATIKEVRLGKALNTPPPVFNPGYSDHRSSANPDRVADEHEEILDARRNAFAAKFCKPPSQEVSAHLSGKYSLEVDCMWESKNESGWYTESAVYVVFVDKPAWWSDK